MKKQIVMALFACMATICGYAQRGYSDPKIFIYTKYFGFYSFDTNELDSIVYTDTDYEVEAYSLKFEVDDAGDLHLKAYVYCGFSVAKMKVAAISETMSNEEVIANYAMGKLSGIVEMDEKGYVDFVVSEGGYKVLVVSEDATGNMRDYAISDVARFPDNIRDDNRSAMQEMWSNGTHFSFGIPAQMIIRDMLTGDYYHVGSTSYSHFISWQQNKYMGADLMKTQFTWEFYNQRIRQLNKDIRLLKLRQKKTTSINPLLGELLVLRANYYLDAARMYEFLPNDKTSSVNADGNDVLGLTIPIIDGAVDRDSVHVPRANRAAMSDYIMQDLNMAQNLVEKQASVSSAPTLAVVYGLKARLCLWNENYDLASQYADLAIRNASVAPVTRSRALDQNYGFNQASDFMWCIQLTQDDSSVQSGIVNWASWTTNQSTFGYTGSATSLYIAMDKSMYERISDTDWRKLEWMAPSGSPLEGQNVFNTSLPAPPSYASLKFRLAEGNADDYAIGACMAVPLMRVEEMYFIKAEAEAQKGNVSNAQITLCDLMQTRDPNYSCHLSGRELIEEIIFQKRVELWGEGQTFFDVKRLNMSVTRGYKGTNCDDQARLNTDGRPAWMNFVIVGNASKLNSALEGWNNPDPSDLYTPWRE